MTYKKLAEGADIKVYAVTYPTGKVHWYVYADGQFFDGYPNRQKMMKLWTHRDGSNLLKDIEPVRLSLADYQKLMVKESVVNVFGAVNEKLDAMRRHLEEARKSMTFGVLPSKADFDKAFEREVPEGEYPYVLKGSDARVANDAGVPTHGKFDADELYDIVKKLTKAYEDDEDDEAGSLASSILDTLGFEWI